MYLIERNRNKDASKQSKFLCWRSPSSDREII